MPDRSIRDLIRQFYTEPEALEAAVAKRREKLVGDAEWIPLGEQDRLLQQVHDGMNTLSFGTVTPEFGDKMDIASEVTVGECGPRIGALQQLDKELGTSYGLGQERILMKNDDCWPCFPVWAGSNSLVDCVRPVYEGKEFPKRPMRGSACSFDRVVDDRGDNYLVRFSEQERFAHGEKNTV